VTSHCSKCVEDVMMTMTINSLPPKKKNWVNRDVSTLTRAINGTFWPDINTARRKVVIVGETPQQQQSRDTCQAIRFTMGYQSMSTPNI